MEDSTFELELRNFKRVMEEAPSLENKWEIDYDGPVRKDYPDSNMKIYKQKLDGEAMITIRIEGTLKGLEARHCYSMIKDVELRWKWDPILKTFKTLEKVSKHSDIVHQEANLPFPLTNRDYVHKRIHLSSRDDPEILKELGLFDWSHHYYIIIVKSVERAECPPQDGVVRGDTKINYWLIEEDPNEKSVVKVKILMCNDLKGMVPRVIVNMAATKIPPKLIGAVLDNYHKLFDKNEAAELPQKE